MKPPSADPRYVETLGASELGFTPLLAALVGPRRRLEAQHLLDATTARIVAVGHETHQLLLAVVMLARSYIEPPRSDVDSL